MTTCSLELGLQPPLKCPSAIHQPTQRYIAEDFNFA